MIVSPRTLFVLLIAGLLCAFVATDDKMDAVSCTSLRYKTLCAEKMKGFTFSRARAIKIESRKDAKDATYQYTMSKGMQYMFMTCNHSTEKPELKITLKNQQKKVMMSNHVASSGKVYDKFVFLCKASGRHYLEFEYINETGQGCGVCVIGFKASEK